MSGPGAVSLDCLKVFSQTFIRVVGVALQTIRRHHMVSAVWATLRSNGLAEEDRLAEEGWLVDVDGWLAGDALTAGRLVCL